MLLKKTVLEKKFLLAILLFAAATRFFNLNNPHNFYFDEVYHAFTASEILKGSPAAWEWWNNAPEGLAYEWTHPPLGKLLMAGGMLIFGQTSFGWRAFGALAGVGVVFLVYLITRKIFQKERIALLAAGLASLDGLILTMSRIGTPDIFLVLFILTSFYFFLKKNYLFSGIFFGLSLSTKWSAVFLLPLFFIYPAFKVLFKKETIRKTLEACLLSFFYFILLPLFIYLSSYFIFFLSGHNLSQFIELQRQMYFYHSKLEATHPYQSPWFGWPILFKPVWFYVNYEGSFISNIYALGNPSIWWGGLIGILFAAWQFLRSRSELLFILILVYFLMWLPWAFSPRITFLYHYLPALPFMIISLAFFLDYLLKRPVWKNLVFVYLALVFLLYLFFYSHWIGISIPVSLDKLYFWFPSWR